MSLITAISLRCDRPGCDVTHEVSSDEFSPLLGPHLRSAAAEGWTIARFGATRLPGEFDLCPEHAPS